MTTAQKSVELQCIFDSFKIDGKKENLEETKILTNFPLSSVPLNVIVHNKKYTLAGIILYEKTGTNGHYTAYTWQNKWCLYDDLKTRRKLVNENVKVCPHVIFYIS